MDHLAARGITCPVPVHRRDGARATELNGRPAAILTFLDGLSLRRPQPAHCAAAGAALAKLHNAGRDFALRRDNTLGLAGWRKLADRHTRPGGQRAGRPAGPDRSSARRGWNANGRRACRPASSMPICFPTMCCSCTMQVSGLIDFYFACNDTYAYDLAVMLNAWCFESDGAFNITKSRSLIAGYRSHRALSERGGCAAAAVRRVRRCASC